MIDLVSEVWYAVGRVHPGGHELVAKFKSPEEAHACAGEMHRRTGGDYEVIITADLDDVPL